MTRAKNDPHSFVAYEQLLRGGARILGIALPLSLVLVADPGGLSGSVANADPGSFQRDAAERALKLALSSNQLDGLSVQELDDGTTILRILGTAKPTFNVYRLGDPNRLVVDVSDAARGKAVPRVPVDSWAVGRVELTSVQEKGAKIARIVINLKREASYIVVPKQKELVITVTPREVPPEAYFARKTAGQHKAEIEAMRRNAESEVQSAKQRAAAAEGKAEKAKAQASAAQDKAKRSRKEAVDALEEARQIRENAERLKAKARQTAESQVAGAKRKAKKAEEQAAQADARAVQAEAEAQKIVSRAKKEEARAARIKGDAEKAAAEMRRMAKAEAEAMRERAAADADKMRVAARREAESLRAEAKTDAARLRKRAKTEAESDARKVRAAAQTEAATLRQAALHKAELEADSMRRAAKSDAAKLRVAATRAEKNAKSVLSTAEAEAGKLRAQAETEASKSKSRARSDADKVRSAAQREAQTLREKAVALESAAQSKAQKLEREAKRLRQEAVAVESQARTRAQAVESDARTHAEKVKADAQREAKSLRDQAEQERSLAKDMLSKAERAVKNAETRRAQADAVKSQAIAARKSAEAAARTDDHKSRSEKKELREAIAKAKAAEAAAVARQKDAEARLTKLRGDRSELAKALTEQKSRNSRLLTRIEAREAKLEELQSQVAQARTRFEKLGGDVSKADVERARAVALRTKATQSVLDKEVKRLKGEAEEARARASKAERRVSRLEKNGSSARQLEVAKLALDKQRKELRDAKVHLTERKRKFDKVSHDLDAKTSEVKKLEQMRATLESQSAELRRKNRAAKGELERAEERMAKLEGSMKSETRELEKLQGELEGARKQLSQSMSAAKKQESLAQQWKREREAADLSRVEDVRFEDSPTESRVIVQLDGPVVYDESRLAPDMVQLKLRGARLPSKLQRSLDATSFRGPVGKISSYKDGEDVKIVVASAPGSGQSVFFDQKKKQLVWKFPRAKKRKGASEVVSMAGNKVGGFVSPPVPLAKTRTGRRAKFRGERVDIELQDAPIKDVLLLFSDIGRVNIISGAGVDGTVTMKLTSVPWDQALDIILRSLGLGMVQEGNVIRVATLSDLEEERRKAIEEAASEVQLRPLQTQLVPLSFATVGDMIPKVQSVLSSRGSVTPDTRTNTLIIMDVAENIAIAESLVGQLDTQTPQVLIEARIVEARTNWLRQLGIQWGFDWTASPGTGNPTGLLFPNSVGVAGGSGSNQSNTNGLILPASAGNPNYAIDLPAPVGTGTGGAIGFSFGSISGNLNTNLRLSAAEDEGEVRIISAPKIVTLDNTQSQIEQGVQIPISQVSAQGVNTRYVNATLALRVTPHVTNEGSVLLDVQVQKNEADFVNTGARGDPTILTKQAQSQMLITDGDTAVIGGIYTRNQSVNRKKVPWLADIPIIGWFFKNKTEADTRTEVLIFLTPKIINRATSIGGQAGG